jgi:hypothetical protein
MDESVKTNVTKGETWMRLVYMVLFAIVLNVAEVVVAVIAVVQFVSKLFSGQINQQLAEFGEGLSIYFRQIIAFLTFRTDDKPFPFAPWPATPAKTAEPPPDGVIEI